MRELEIEHLTELVEAQLDPDPQPAQRVATWLGRAAGTFLDLSDDLFEHVFETLGERGITQASI